MFLYLFADSECCSIATPTVYVGYSQYLLFGADEVNYAERGHILELAK